MRKLMCAALALVAAVGCGRSEQTVPTAAPPTVAVEATVPLVTPVASPVAERVFDMKAKIVSRDAAKGIVNLENEDVPGVMAPMKMDYELRGATVDTLPPDGSKVTVKLHEQSGNFWVTDVKPQ